MTPFPTYIAIAAPPHSIERVDLSQVIKQHAADVGIDPTTATLDQLCYALNEHIHASMHSSTAFAVELHGTILASNYGKQNGGIQPPTQSAAAAAVQVKRKEDLLFVESRDVELFNYVQLQAGYLLKRGKKNSLSARAYQAICLPEQELVCLFPHSIDTELCKRIATGVVGAKRQVYRRRGSRDSRAGSPMPAQA